VRKKNRPSSKQKGSLNRQLSKRSQSSKRSSTSGSLWSGKLAPIALHGTQPRDKRTYTLPPPKGQTRTIQELEEILITEMQRRYELEDLLHSEILARQELDKKLADFLLLLKDAARLLSPPDQ